MSNTTKFVCEVGKRQLIKHGEVTCGDSVEVVYTPEETFVVLSDGLGSGVKANILSNLTVKIISKMVSHHVPLQDIVETIIGTLPVCSVRGLAYSTFTLLRITPDGMVDIIDFDGLPPITVSKGCVEVVERTSEDVLGKKINKAQIQLKEDDYLLITSDGVTEAGLGLTLSFGLQTAGLVKALKEHVKDNKSAQDLVNQVIDICMSYYINEPGDDTTAVAIHLRQPRECALLTGLPADKNDDAGMIQAFQQCAGRKIICGGTTAQVYARETHKEVRSVDGSLTDEVPPISKIDGVDLVTEGIITMDYCTRLLEADRTENIPKNGASMLLEQLLWADKVTIFCGTQVNEAYEQIKPGMRLRDTLVEKLTRELEHRHKEVVIYYY